MVEAIALTCTKCGSQLELPQGISQFACSHCGVHHTVNRGGGIVSIEPIVEGLDEIREGTDRTSSELAIKRLKKERAAIKQRISNLENAVGLSTSAGVLTGIGILLLVGAFLFVWFISVIVLGLPLSWAGLLLMLGGACVGGGIVLFRKWDRKRKIFKTKIGSLEQQYGNKSAEIEHHKKVVSLPARQIAP